MSRFDFRSSAVWRFLLVLTVKALWFATAVVILVISILADDRTPGNDAHMFFGLTMFALTCPGGLMVALPFSYALEQLLPAGLLSSELQWETGVFWGLMMLGGYLQWFVLVPLVTRWGWRSIRKYVNSEGSTTRIDP